MGKNSTTASTYHVPDIVLCSSELQTTMNILYIFLSDFKRFEWHWVLVRLRTFLSLISGQDFPLCCSSSLRNMGKPRGLTWKIFFFKSWLLKHFFLFFRDFISQVKLKLFESSLWSACIFHNWKTSVDTFLPEDQSHLFCWGSAPGQKNKDKHWQYPLNP